MKKIVKQWWFWVAVAITIISAFTPQIISAIYPMEGVWFTVTSFEDNELLSFYGSFLSFIGTVALGALALWQNNKFKDENDKSQQRLETLTLQANSISEKMLELEKNNTIPYIRLFDFYYDPKSQGKPNIRSIFFTEKSLLRQNNYESIHIIVENISNIGISYIEILELKVNGIVYKDFETENCGLNSQSLLILTLSFTGINNLPRESNKEKLTIDLEFSLILYDFWGNKYQQNIFIKVDGLKIGTATQRSTINKILKYCSEKPIKIQEETQNEQQ